MNMSNILNSCNVDCLKNRRDQNLLKLKHVVNNFNELYEEIHKIEKCYPNEIFKVECFVEWISKLICSGIELEPHSISRWYKIYSDTFQYNNESLNNYLIDLGEIKDGLTNLTNQWKMR